MNKVRRNRMPSCHCFSGKKLTRGCNPFVDLRESLSIVRRAGSEVWMNDMVGEFILIEKTLMRDGMV